MTTSKKGFTLIEILVVISIIGLLSSVFLVGLSGFRSRGRDARRLADIKSVQQGVEIYYTRCGRYPGDAGCVSGTAGEKTWQQLSAAIIDPNLGLGISKVPNDPLTGENYVYAVNANGQSYVVGAKLENEGDRSLDEDTDNVDLTGLGFGTIDCDDPVYCVRF